MSKYLSPPDEVLWVLREGLVIPAHPLALTKKRKLDEKRQKALSRYYISAGCRGLAVGVHTTQFQIHEPKVGLYRPVLELAAEVVDECSKRPIAKIAGICGLTKQAVSEAKIAADLGYHAGLLSLAAFRNSSYEEMLAHSKEVARILPLFGFYLQPAAGGRVLGFDFWRRFVEIENVIAIKIAPFNRYYTLNVVRAVAEAGRADEIALYTGNDDNIVGDLLSVFEFDGKRLRIAGGLLGHWAFWTKKAVELLQEIHKVIELERPIPPSLLKKGVEITDVNGAVFDPANGFRGCIPGIQEILRRQGLLEGRWCIDPNLALSPGQMGEIDRVYKAYPHLDDDSFVAEHLDEWLK